MSTRRTWLVIVDSRNCKNLQCAQALAARQKLEPNLVLTVPGHFKHGIIVENGIDDLILEDADSDKWLDGPLSFAASMDKINWLDRDPA